MAEFKLTIADPKTGKCAQKTVEGDSAKNFIGLRIGDSIKGEVMDLTGYEFVVTGGSDYCGFPMRKGIQSARKRVLIGKGVGFRGGKKGIRRRKTVCGETVTEKVIQINLKVTKSGKADLFAKEAASGEKPQEGAKPTEGESKPEAPKAEETPKEAPKEEKKEAPKGGKSPQTQDLQSSSESQQAEISSKAETKEKEKPAEKKEEPKEEKPEDKESKSSQGSSEAETKKEG